LFLTDKKTLGNKGQRNKVKPYNDIKRAVKEVLDKFKADFIGKNFVPRQLFPIRDLKLIYMKIKGIQNYLESLPINRFPNSAVFQRILRDLKQEERFARQNIYSNQIEFLKFIVNAVDYIKSFLETLKHYEIYQMV